MADIKPFFRGDNRKYTFRIADKDGVPISVDGGKLTVTFKTDKSLDDSESTIQKSVNGIEPDPANPMGVIILQLNHDDTSVPPGNYYYDFQFVSNAGEFITILPSADPNVGDTGKVKILEDVTQT
jgi:hypothetical protein